MKQPKTKVLQGSPKQIAEGIFDNMIVPMHSQMANVSERDADEFAFCIAGTAVAGFLASANDLDSAKDLILQYIEVMYHDIKVEQQDTNILPTHHMGKPI
ncbi:hypothetical protein [Acinetobacter johnsonii]|uniref:hypothetical protein n=1 Tax=Acinetobacter johnsonii TaxID=40214 RepID=UPI001919CC53|nr:hypothetical protein [Acinetobacter johnsonii]QQT94600.1 hypothetical protein I6I51_07925 [Acinetobacter johnsonii]